MPLHHNINNSNMVNPVQDLIRCIIDQTLHRISYNSFNKWLPPLDPKGWIYPLSKLPWSFLWWKVKEVGIHRAWWLLWGRWGMVKGRCRCRLDKDKVKVKDRDKVKDRGKDKDKADSMDHLVKEDLDHHMVNLDILKGKDKDHLHHNIHFNNSVFSKWCRVNNKPIRTRTKTRTQIKIRINLSNTLECKEEQEHQVR
jgi:hypothetical protein